MLGKLRESEILNNTIVVILSDHGESLGENDHYFAHGHNVTPELIEIPLLVAVPKRSFEKHNYPVQNVDVAPTLLQLLNITVPTSFRGQGLFRPDPARQAIAEQPNIRWAIYTQNGTYVYERTGEEKMLAGNQSISAELRARVQKWISDHLYNGLVFAFSGETAAGTKIQSNQPIRRAYLFGGESEDRIQIAENSVTVQFSSPQNDVDFVFLEAFPNSELSVAGVPLTTGKGKSLSPTFRASDIAISPSLPGLNDFTTPGCIVIQKPGKPTQLDLTEEQKEELRSIGYVN